MRVAFQGEAGAFSEAAAVQLLGEQISTVPRLTFDAAFRAIAEGAADALLVPVENSLAGSVVRVYDLLLESDLTITAETILPIELHLIASPGSSLADIRAVSSHPMALAQCERFFSHTRNASAHPPKIPLAASAKFWPAATKATRPSPAAAPPNTITASFSPSASKTTPRTLRDLCC